jgi:hypothetical protein
MLDRQTDRWYNKSTERGQQKTQAEKNLKKLKKRLDKRHKA